MFSMGAQIRGDFDFSPYDRMTVTMINNRGTYNLMWHQNYDVEMLFPKYTKC